MKIDTTKEMIAEVIGISKGDCRLRVIRRINGLVVSEEIVKLKLLDHLHMRLSSSFTYEIDTGEEIH